MFLYLDGLFLSPIMGETPSSRGGGFCNVQCELQTEPLLLLSHTCTRWPLQREASVRHVVSPWANHSLRRV